MNNPFPGLRPFQLEESHLFFGREEQTGQLLERLGNTRFLAVVGASGSGKSSLVRAGLLPQLYGGTMVKTSVNWEIAIMRPGGNPITNLARCLVDADIYEDNSEDQVQLLRTMLSRSGLGLLEAYRQSDIEQGSNMLILVDQFEEIFRFRRGGSKESEEAADFIELILEACWQEELPIYVILTMRSDFLGDCAEFKSLAEAVNEGEYLIPRLNRRQRAHAIEGPAKVGGGQMSPRLVQQLLNDIGDDPDQLPILQHSLMRTWEYWEEHIKDNTKPLDVEHYRAIGTMKEALSRHADEAYNQLPDDHHRIICERMFKSITERGNDGRGIRRPMPFSNLIEIVGGNEQTLMKVIDDFRITNRSFIMPLEHSQIHINTVIDISHESLMRVWERLCGWVDEESQSARIYLRLAETSALHTAGEASLYHDPDLRIAITWRDKHNPNECWANRYSGDFKAAMKFLEDSQRQKETDEKAKEEARIRELEQAKALAEAEKERAEIQQKSAKRNKVFAVFLFGLVVLTGILAYQATQSENTANQRLVDINFKTANQYLDQDRPDRAIELLLETYKYIKKDPSIISKLGSIITTHHYPKHLGITGNAEMELDLNHMRGLKISKNGSYGSCINNGAQKSRLKILNLNKPYNIIFDEEYEQLNFSIISNDENITAVGGRINGRNCLKLYDLINQKELADITMESPVDCGVFSGDNSVFYAGRRDGILNSIQIKSLEKSTVLNLSGQQFERMYSNPVSNNIIAFSQRDGIGEIHEIKDNKFIITIAQPDTDGFYPNATFSNNGEYFILGIGGFTYGQVSVYKGSLKNRIWENTTAHKRIIVGLDVSSDNGKLVTASLDKTAYIWDLKTGKLLSPVMQHDVFAWWAKFSEDNSKIVTTTDNNGISIWNTKTGKILTPPFYTDDTILDINFSHDGTRVSAGLLNGEFHEWDIHTGRPIKTDLSHDNPIASTAVSKSGEFIISGDLSGKIKKWDKSKQYLEPKSISNNKKIGSIRIIDNDKKFAAIYENGVNSWEGVDIWDASTLKKLNEYSFRKIEPEKIITWIDVSPDGNYIAYSIEDENSIKLINLKENKPARIIGQHRNIIWQLHFSPNSKYLASVSQDGTSKIFNVNSDLKNFKTLSFKFGFGGSVVFSPDSKKIAAATIVGGDKNIVKIWNSESGELLNTLKHSYAVRSITFSRYGNSVYTGSSDLYVRYWDLNAKADSPLFSLKHEDRVELIEEYPDFSKKNIIMTVTDSGTVRIWDTFTQKAILGPIHNRSEVAPWQRKIAFLENGKKFLYNHSRELIHISHFPIDYYLSLSPNSMLNLAEYFMKKQKGLMPDQLDNTAGDLKSFIKWYEENDNPLSFFEEGINLSKMSDAYLKQNTTNSRHSSDLIKSKLMNK